MYRVCVDTILVHFQPKLKIEKKMDHFRPFLTPFGAILGPQKASGAPICRGEPAKLGQKGGQQAIKICFGTVLDHLDTILAHFQPKLKIEKKGDFDHFGPFGAILSPFWPLLGPFGVHFGPTKGLGSPKMQGGTGQNGPKGSQQAIKMCFETVLDHLDTILVHFQPKLKIGKISRF